jgi:hypothetical protein
MTDFSMTEPAGSAWERGLDGLDHFTECLPHALRRDAEEELSDAQFLDGERRSVVGRS